MGWSWSPAGRAGVGNGSSRHVSIATRHREWRRVGPTAWPPGFFVCFAALYAVKETKNILPRRGTRGETGQVALLRRIETTGRPPKVRPHPAHGHRPSTWGLPKLTALRLGRALEGTPMEEK